MGNSITWAISSTSEVQVIKVYEYNSPDGKRHNINVQFPTAVIKAMGSPKKVDIGFNKDLTEIYIKASPTGLAVCSMNTTINKLVRTLGIGVLGSYEGSLVGDNFIGIKRV